MAVDLILAKENAEKFQIVVKLKIPVRDLIAPVTTF